MTTAELIRKSFPAETKVLDAEQGLVDCVWSVTGNVDRQNDVIESGAFSKALAAQKSIPVVYAHQWDQLDAVLGKTVSAEELLPGDPRLPVNLKTAGCGGVRSTVKFDLETPSGRLAFTHVKNGNLTEWSFAFDVAKGGSEVDEKGVRHITAGGINEIYEASLVLIGANPATATMGVKSMEAVDAKTAKDALLQAEAETRAPFIDAEAKGRSYEERQDAIRSALQAQYSMTGADGIYIWIRLTYDDRVVFCVDSGPSAGDYLANYSIDDQGIALVGTAQPVDIRQVAVPIADPGIDNDQGNYMSAPQEEAETKTDIHDWMYAAIADRLNVPENPVTEHATPTVDLEPLTRRLHRGLA